MGEHRFFEVADSLELESLDPCAWSDGAERLLVTGYAGAAIVTHLGSVEGSRALPEDERVIGCVMHPVGGDVLTVNRDKLQPKVYSVTETTPALPLAPLERGLTNGMWCDGNRLVAAGTKGNSLALWDARTGALEYEVKAPVSFPVDPDDPDPVFPAPDLRVQGTVGGGNRLILRSGIQIISTVLLWDLDDRRWTVFV